MGYKHPVVMLPLACRFVGVDFFTPLDCLRNATSAGNLHIDPMLKSRLVRCSFPLRVSKHKRLSKEVYSII